MERGCSMSGERQWLKTMVWKGSAVHGDVNNKRRPIGRHRTVVNPYPTFGRNKLCPCGSGKKFKVCHNLIRESFDP